MNCKHGPCRETATAGRLATAGKLAKQNPHGAFNLECDVLKLITEIRPQPHLLRHRAWSSARAGLLRMADQPGIIALLGAAGVGKTTMLGALEAELRAQGHAPQRVECGDLLAAPFPPLLLVDEADRIEDAVLATLARENCVAVLAALPGFAARLAELPHRLVRLHGLQEEEVPGYVAARLATLGLPADRIASAALSALGEASAGVPRRLNVLIGSSLFMAEMDGVPQATPSHVQAAAQMHALPEHGPEHGPEPGPEPAHAASPDPLPGPALAEPGPQPGQVLMLPPEAAAPDMPPPRRRMGWIAFGLAGLAAAAGGLALFTLAERPSPPPPTTSGSASGPATEPATEIRIAGPDAVMPVGARPDATLSNATLSDAAISDAAMPAQVASSGSLPATALSGATLPGTDMPAADLPGAAMPAEPEATRAFPPLPQRPASRIVLTYPRGDAAAAGRGAELAQRLRQGGATVAAPFPVSAGAEADALRYFFIEDREAAQAIAAAAGRAPTELRLGEVPDGAPLPRPGTLEWAVSAAPTAAARDGEPAPPPAATDLARPAASQPPDGTVVEASAWPAPVELAWTGTEQGEARCCFVEILGLAADATWQEVFAGNAEAAGRHRLRLAEPMDYAWRVLRLSREGPRYVAGPWSHFTLRQAAP